jgi:translation initiation factor 1A
MTDDSKADIVHKYTSDEARTIVKRGELPDKFLVEMTEESAVAAAATAADDDDGDIMFEDADIDAM